LSTGRLTAAESPAGAALELRIRRRLRGYVMVIALVSLAVGGALGFWAARGMPAVEAELLPTPVGWACGHVMTGSVTPTPGSWQVYVSGAVIVSGVVTVPAGSLVEAAIAAAGGPAPDADLDRVNLAAPLSNHQQVNVPRRRAAAESTATVGPISATLNLNTASAVDLERLPRIGPATAERIVAYRQAHGPFRRLEELLEVPGIGPATLAQIAPYLTVEP